MTYTIPADSPKAVKAAAFGRELVKACRARGVPLKELERATGVGHTSLDNYRRGLILPKVEVAKALAHALDWPQLASMIVAARTFACARAGCERTFRNDTGAPRRYCSEMCRRIAQNLRDAEHRRRSGGQTGDRRTLDAALRQLRSGLAIADERSLLLEGAIDAMCRGCEPDGVCRLADCPLRPFSPLPLAVHLQRAEPRTEFEIRSSARSRPEVVAAASEKMRAWHADPANAAMHSERIRAAFARRTPAAREAWIAKIAATKAARRSTSPASDGSGPRRPTPRVTLSAALGVRPPLPSTAVPAGGVR